MLDVTEVGYYSVMILSLELLPPSQRQRVGLCNPVIDEYENIQQDNKLLQSVAISYQLRKRFVYYIS